MNKFIISRDVAFDELSSWNYTQKLNVKSSALNNEQYKLETSIEIVEEESD